MKSSCPRLHPLSPSTVRHVRSLKVHTPSAASADMLSRGMAAIRVAMRFMGSSSGCQLVAALCVRPVESRYGARATLPDRRRSSRRAGSKMPLTTKWFMIGRRMELPNILGVLAQGTTEDLEALTRLIDGFPEGRDDWGDPWIIDAITYGSRAAVQWMISRGVDLTVQDSTSCSVLHAAVEREEPDKYEILDSLLRHGAPVNVRGWLGFAMTPAHLAVMH